MSLVLATWADDYVAGLTATRYAGEPGSEAAHTGINRWTALFAAACRRAVADAGWFEERVRQLQETWRQRAGNPRRDSAVQRLIGALPAAPVLTVATAAGLIGRSFQAANQAMDRLVEAGVLVQINVGRRNRAFEAPDSLICSRRWNGSWPVRRAIRWSLIRCAVCRSDGGESCNLVVAQALVPDAADHLARNIPYLAPQGIASH